MQQRYSRPHGGVHSPNRDDAKKLAELVPRGTHNVYFRTHPRIGSRIVRTPDCPKCHEERPAQCQALDEKKRKAQPPPA